MALVLLANNLADIDYDRQAGIHTLGTVLGKQKTISLFFWGVTVIYSITVLEILAGVILIWGLLTGLSFPVIYRFILKAKREPAIPTDADPQTTKAATLYGILLIVAILLAA